MFEIQLAPRPQPIQVPNMPLVTPASPAVTGDTAGNFIKAIRDGFITSQDIADRLGELGQSQRAAEIQKNREVVDPAAIAARATARDAAAAEAAIAKRKAEVALPNVPEKESLELDALRAKTAETVYGDAIQAYKRYHPPLFRPDGKPANEEMAEMGTYYKRAELLKARAEEGLKAAPIKFFRDGQERQTFLNAFDEDVTPPMDGSTNPNRKKYLQMREEADWMIASPSEVIKRQKELKEAWYPKDKGRTAAKGSGKPVVEPSGKVRESTLPSVPQAPAEKTYVPGTGLPVSAGTSEADVEKQVLSYTDDVRKSPQYQAWSEKMSAINALDEIEKAYATNPEITNVLDSALAGVTLQLLSPGPSASARSFQDFRVANIEEHAQTLREKIADLPEKLLGKDRFEPGARARIIAEARRLVTAKENSAATVLKRAQDFATAKQADPFFDDKEKAILARAAQPAPPPGAPGAAAGTVQTQPGVYKLPSGRTISFTPRAPAPASKPFTPAAPAPALVTPKAPATEQDVARGFVDLWRQTRTP